MGAQQHRDFPSVDWDGIYGHDYTLRRALIAHVTDGAGVFNTAAPGTNVNVEWDQVYVTGHFLDEIADHVRSGRKG